MLQRNSAAEVSRVELAAWTARQTPSTSKPRRRVCSESVRPAQYVTAPYRLLDNDLLLSEQEKPYVLRVRDLDEADRPREKMLKYGPSDLSLAEIVAVLLGVGTKREDVLVMAHRILKEYGDRAIAAETNPTRIAETLDIPLTKACQLVAGFEIGRRFYAQRAGKPVVICTAAQAFQYLDGMGNLQKEQLRALYLGSRYQLVHEEVVSVGSLTANIVHPREIFQPAIQYGAAAVIIAHNHPSGSLEPTNADAAVTLQIIEAGKLLGIDLLDHLIIAGEHYLSMMEDTDAHEA